MSNETGSHRIPTDPPFELQETIRYLGVPDGSTIVMGVTVGATGTVIRNVSGHQASGKVRFKDKHGEVADVTMDGYSIVLSEGGITAAITLRRSSC